GIELAVARCLRQVTGVFLQRVIGVLGRSGVRGTALAQDLDRSIQVLRRDAAFAENAAGCAIFLKRQAEQQSLDGDKTVAGLLGRLFRSVEGTRELRREINLACTASRHSRQLVERVLGRFQDLAGVAPGAIYP